MDVCVIRQNDNKLKFKVYRKPTHSNMYIHNFSNHSESIKTGAISSIFLRAYRISDPEFLDEELQFITQTFENLGYTKSFIQNSHLKARKTFYTPILKIPADQSKVVVLPSNCKNVNINNLFSADTKIAFRSSSTTKQFLRHFLTKSFESDAGIYAIPCSTCPKRYIGESDDIKRRLYAHSYDLKCSKEESPLFKHMSTFDHIINTKNAVTIGKVRDVQERKLIESVLINKIPNINSNSKSTDIDYTVCNLLCKYVPKFSKLLTKFDNG